MSTIHATVTAPDGYQRRQVATVGRYPVMLSDCPHVGRFYWLAAEDEHGELSAIGGRTFGQQRDAEQFAANLNDRNAEIGL